MPTMRRAAIWSTARAAPCAPSRFDLARLAVVGTPVPVVPQVLTKNVGAVDFALAPNGTLVYVTGVFQSQAPQVLAWVNRQGREERNNVRAGVYASLRLSPDGTRVALDVRGEQAGIWIGDLIRGNSTRLTFGTTSASVSRPAINLRCGILTGDGFFLRRSVLGHAIFSGRPQMEQGLSNG